jgi:hypothetical protein
MARKGAVQPAAGPWVNMEERLPPERGKYLVRIVDDGDIEIAFERWGDGGWLDLNLEQIGDCVTHWARFIPPRDEPKP